ncbi:MAG: 1,4-alpha-glucan branching protein GlgB [Thermoguttaceae bacterium]
MLMTSAFSHEDLYLFNEGTHVRLYEKLGAHPRKDGTASVTDFAVWAPNAEQVCVMGDFNGWSKTSHPLESQGESGIWENTVPNVVSGARYKYHVVSRYNGYEADKTDPFAFYAELSPQTASVVWDLDYPWQDAAWMRTRAARHALDAPLAIYEMHLGSWRRSSDSAGSFCSYRAIAAELAEYVRDRGFTHVEFLPLMEHPFYGSWGYQTTGYFAPTSRYGTPQDFMFLVDCLHRQGIGVILDWVPSHFTTDGHGLGYFDGTHLYEHADPRRGVHPEWHSFLFNYGRNEVRAFLLSSALFWLDMYHIDGLRVDAVASMLYLDYARANGQWLPNRFGGRENLEAVQFLRTLNERVYANHPDTITIAEESTAWPMVSRPVYVGGLGFGYKWDMGWMHDTLEYMRQDPLFRRYHHDKLTFRMMYAFSENFVLPLSHDEVVYGKGSLLAKMPGDAWQKFANLRLLLGAMYAQPGKKLLFMGGEFGQWNEWNHDSVLDWELLQSQPHAGLQRWVDDLNRLYRHEPALHRLDCDPRGFQWIDCHDSDQSVLTFLRKGADDDADILVACNFTPVPRTNYRVGTTPADFWEEILNSDATHYGGSGWGNLGGVESSPIPCHGRPASVVLALPPLAIVFFKARKEARPAANAVA